MKRLSSAAFRRAYAREREPVEVTSFDDVLGIWYPAGTGPDTVTAEAPSEAPTPRFTIRPAHGPRRTMVGTETRLLDPVEMRKQEQERSEAIAGRTFGPKRHM